MHWNILSPATPSTPEDIQAVLLANRGITDMARFFAPRNPVHLTLEDVGIDPEQMRRAIERIRLAKERKELVIVFGDYDADGVCSTAILWETLYEMGVKVLPFIPHREKHGYGMTDRSLDALLAEYTPALVITVDNGIVAHAAVERLNAAGIDVIVTDHHVPEAKSEIRNPKSERQISSSNLQVPISKDVEALNNSQPTTHLPAVATALQAGNSQLSLPNALAIVHSTQLCGATVAWFVARELDAEKAAYLLDLCAIATIADQMVLVGPNREFAYHGLVALRHTNRVGLINLLSLAGIAPRDVTARTINYALAPRINAMGRLASALDALRALCTKDQQKSLALMSVLQQTNTQRQSLTVEMLERAKAEAETWEDERIIIVASDQFHDGVIGLIAGRLCEEYHKPAIAISIGEKFAKASARSVDGINIVELIREVRDDLLEVGGHPMAAGFGLLPEKVAQVTARLRTLARERIDLQSLQASLDIDVIMSMESVTLETCEMLQQLEPFGNGNSEPLFGFRQLCVEQVYSVGKDKKHLKLVVSSQVSEDSEPIKIDCIGFGLGLLADTLQRGDTIAVAATLSINEWNDRKSVQLVIKDVEIA